MRGLRIAQLLALATACPSLGGCRPKDPGDSGGADTEPPFVWRDTGAVVETGDPDTATADDTGLPPDTGDTGDVQPTIAGLELFPGGLAVFPEASWGLRVVAEDDAGLSDVAAEQVTFTSSDDSVVAVDATGQASAVGEGEATLWAAYGGLEASVTVEVIPAGYAELTVLDAASGAALVRPWGSTPDSTRITGDEAGLVQVPVSEPGPVTFTAWDDDHIPLSVMGTVNRRLRLPLRTVESVHDQGVDLHGEVDFDGVDPGSYSDVIVGLAAASIQHHPLCFDLPDLIAEDREVSIWGVPAELPGNLFVHGVLEDWQGHAAAGDFGAWSLAGPVPIADITAAINGEGAGLLELLLENLDVFSYGFTSGWTGADGDAVEVPVAPSMALSEPVQVSSPELSLGFSGDEVPLVFIADHASDGTFAVSGLGWGTGEQLAQRAPLGSVPPGTESWALAVAQVGGLGSGGAMALSAALVEGGAAALPPYQIIPVFESFAPETQDYAFSTDPRATLVRVTVSGRHGDVWDLCFHGGEQLGTLHQPQGYGFDFGVTSWQLTALELTGETLDSLAGQGSLWDDALAPRARTSARKTANYAL